MWNMLNREKKKGNYFFNWVKWKNIWNEWISLEKYLEFTFKVTFESKLHWIQNERLHGILPTNNSLSKICKLNIIETI